MKTKIEPGDYVLATKWQDGDPFDHWFVGFYHGILEKYSAKRYEVVDSDGNPARGNGFRRIKKISKRRGQWLLDHRKEITSSDRSLWWWVRRKMD